MTHNTLKFEAYVGDSIPITKLQEFLATNYTSTVYTADYLRWFLGKDGVLCSYEDDSGGFVVTAIASVFDLIFSTQTYTILQGGPICVHKKFRSKRILLPFLKKVEKYKKANCPYPAIANARGAFNLNPSPTQKVLFQNFGTFAVDKSSLRQPSHKIFGSHNMHLDKKDGHMLDFYVNDQGWVGVLYYDVNDSLWSKTSKKLGKIKLGVVVSYVTKESWNSFLYQACKEKFLNKCDKVVVFENYERKAASLEEMGFEKISNYSLFHDIVDENFLYYNFFLY